MFTRSATAATVLPGHDNRLERLFEDVWNGSNPDTAAELVHQEFVIHDRDLAEELRGPALYRAFASETREIFPDATSTVEDTVAAGEMVALRWTMTGPHEGELAGVDGTGTRVTLPAIEIDRFEDGLLVETWTQSDQLGLLEQVDALPSGE